MVSRDERGSEWVKMCLSLSRWYWGDDDRDVAGKHEEQVAVTPSLPTMELPVGCVSVTV